jgi:glucosamine-6-phosphate deaminase
MAFEVVELIQENNAKGEPTVMIVPYGPLGPYSRLVYLINKHRVSLKNCWFINMDEYLDEQGQYLPKTDPLSFRGGMDRIFYGLVDEELLMPEEQRIFPEPGNEGYIWELIQKFGKLDHSKSQTAGARLHKKSVSGAQTADLDQIEHGCGENFRQSGPFNE